MKVLIRAFPVAAVIAAAALYATQRPVERVKELDVVVTRDGEAATESSLEREEQFALQEQAIFALSQHPSPRSQEILRSFAARDNAPVELREKAIFWLGNQGSQESQDFLRDLFASVSNEQLKEKIIFAVSQQASQESGDWLLTVVNDRDQAIEIRKNALFWLGQEHGLSAADLDRVYESAGALELKEQVLFVLSQAEESWAVAQLIDMARAETDLELRKKALFWLGQSSDPRAAEFLLEVIGQ